MKARGHGVSLFTLHTSPFTLRPASGPHSPCRYQVIGYNLVFNLRLCLFGEIINSMVEKAQYLSFTSWVTTARPFAVWCLAFLLFADVVVALPQGGPSVNARGSTVDAAQHWSSWRGSFGTGSAASGSPPTQWAEKSEQGPAKNIAWKVEIPGLGSS